MILKTAVLSTVLYSTILFSSPVHAANPPLEPPYTQGPSKSSSSSIEKPTSIDEDTGDYFYHPLEAQDSIQYEVTERPPIKGAMFLRFGTIGPYDIKSDNNASTYEDVYTDSSSFLAYFEYERQLFHLLGKWSLKIGSGVTVEEGQGHFADPSNTGIPKEKFSFLVMPNTAMLNYKLRFSDKQILIPYFEGGAGYFTFVEYRNDGNRTAFGGAPVLAAAGGLLISISNFDKYASSVMYEEYGITHLWFDLQFRHNQGLSDEKDFTSDMMTAGFGFAF